MKYDVSQGQYADFLNKLTPAQTNNNYPAGAAGNYRWSITGGSPNYSASAPDRACDHLHWRYGVNYAAWAGLRPMTELEYEKTCRGVALPATNEYAWGNAAYTQLTGFTGTDGSGTETASPTNANCSYGNNMGGPARVGLYATAGAGRVAAGAGYYGVMELSGTLMKQCVSAGHPTGRSFQGTHGTGVLSASGLATNADWPVFSNPNVYGAGDRGGDWYEATTGMRVSDRDLANDYCTETPSGSYKCYGWRAVRTAP